MATRGKYSRDPVCICHRGKGDSKKRLHVRDIVKRGDPGSKSAKGIVLSPFATIFLQNADMNLIAALHTLSHHILFHNLTAPEQILVLFPKSFHPSLKNLITKIMLEHSPTWRNEALSNQISLPHLVEMDWRVDMKTASDSVSRMAVPTCLVHMKMEDSSCLSGSGAFSSVTVELSKETLDTMLDGLGRIRDQLSVVAGK